MKPYHYYQHTSWRVFITYSSYEHSFFLYNFLYGAGIKPPVVNYMNMCVVPVKDIEQSSYLPMFTDDGLYDRSKGSSVLIETEKMDYAKINAALEEYWNNNVHN